MDFKEMNTAFFRACHKHGLAMPIDQWVGWATFEAVWCMGGEL